MGGKRLRRGLEGGGGGGGGGGEGAGGGGFARALASSDWHTRERGLLALERFLRVRGGALSAAELRRLWRGLFYCFWHADLPPVQAALAQRLAGFLRIGGEDEGAPTALPEKKRRKHEGSKPGSEARAEAGPGAGAGEESGGEVLEGDLAGRYLRAFMWTMAHEWGGLDRHRLDKFMLLVREFLRAALQRLQGKGWDVTEATEVAEALAEALDPPGPGRQGSLGVALHLADILVPELELACAPEGGEGSGSGSGSGSVSNSDSEDAELPEMIPGDALTALLEPFVGCACRAPGTSMRARTSELFMRLQDRTLRGLRYLLSGKGAQGGIPFIQLDARTLGEVMFEAAAAAETRQEDREALYTLVPGFEKVHALQQDLVAGRGADQAEDEGEEDSDEDEEGEEAYLASESDSEEDDGDEDDVPIAPIPDPENMSASLSASSDSAVFEEDDPAWDLPSGSGSGSGSGEELGELGGTQDARDAEEEEAQADREEERRSEKKARKAARKESDREAKREKARRRRGLKNEGSAELPSPEPARTPVGGSDPSTPGNKRSVHFRLKKNMVREFLKTEKLLCSPSLATPLKSALRAGQASSPLYPRFVKKQRRESESAARGEAPWDAPPPQKRGRGRGRGGSPRGGHSRGRGRGGSPRGGRSRSSPGGWGRRSSPGGRGRR